MASKEYSHIKTEIGKSPVEFDIAIVSINERGSFGGINQVVMGIYGYDFTSLDNVDTSKGYFLIQYESLKPILFIVTVGLGPVGISLQKNLNEGINSNHKFLKGKNIWVPLMGTGEEGLDFVDSYDTTIGVLKKFKDISFTIAIPNNNKGKEFIKQFRVDNLQTKSDLKGNVKSGSSVSGTLSQERPKQTGYDNLPGFNVHRLVRDVLNKEFNLDLSIDGYIGRHGFTQRFDLSDHTKESYVQLLEKSKFVGVKSDSAFTAGTSEVGIMSTIFADIENKINFLQSTGTRVQKYFAIFSRSFTEDNIKYAIKWFENRQQFDVDVFTLNDIIKLADKNEIDHGNYLQKNVKSELDLNKGNDKIPFHLDQVVVDDKLGREPVAKAFVDLIKKDIFTDELKHSFIVHLQGEWGAGKSSFLNFIKKNLNAEGKKWIVVEYNAWQNQHINPPWWSFIDQVYQQSKKEFVWWYDRLKLRFCENFRRIIWYSAWYKIMSFFISLVLLTVIFLNWEVLYSFVFNRPITDGEFKPNDFAGFAVAIGAIIGLIYSFSKFLSTPILLNSAGEAKSFVLKATDPMNRIKKHFNDLISNINEAEYEVAIFIDDIDRCDKEFIVNLLEGVQTLFKEKRVLYIVSGDKNWITTSFGTIYEDFALDENNKKRLGELFLEKAFQLSFRMPNISEQAKQNYWNHILGVKNNEEDSKVDSIGELSESEQREIKNRLSSSKSELTNPDFMRTIEKDFNLTGDTVSNMVIEEKNKDTEELKHLLQNYHGYIDTNPRSIIRLANNYTMIRSTLIAERAVFNEQKLFRWLVIEDLYPSVKNIIPTAQTIDMVGTAINEQEDIKKRNNCLILLNDSDSLMGGSISIEEIKVIKGF